MGERALKLLRKLRKDRPGNAADRRFFFSLKDKRAQSAVWHACADGDDGLIFWVNTFAWTYRQKKALPDGTEISVLGQDCHVPFVTFGRPVSQWDDEIYTEFPELRDVEPVQDKVLRELWHAIHDGHDVLMDKSRDMGASWLCLSVIVWFWLFSGDSTFKVASRKEELVDRDGDPDSMFWRIDYMRNRLPRWMYPKMGRRDRTHMHMRNDGNNSVIDGESTNKDLAVGGRRTAILLDEAGRYDKCENIDRGTSDVTACRIWNSTPTGRGHHFAEIRFSGKTKVVTLPWWEHPEKGHNRRRIVTADKIRKWTSPWYEDQGRRRASKKDVAQNLDIDYLSAGDNFFDLDVLQHLLSSGQLKSAPSEGEVQFRVDTHKTGEVYGIEDIQWAPGEGQQRLKVWCPLELDPNAGKIRPTQDHNYVAFADISLGQGESNSVLDVWDCNTREQVAQFVDPDIPPHSFGHYAVAVAKWFGGACGWTFLGWERNGPGDTFGWEVLRAQYPYIYHQRDITQQSEPRSKKFGWWSTTDRKRVMFGDMRTAVGRGEIKLRCEHTVSEMMMVVLGTANEPIQGPLAELESGARNNHGDRVVAAAGCVMLMHEQPRAKPPDMPVKQGSYMARRRDYEQKQKKPAGRW